jgi:hypothetical protein
MGNHPNRSKKAKRFDSCTVVRRCLVTHGTLNIVSGAITESKSAWETKPCGTPLFGDDERASGKCKACAEGWTHPNNYPVETNPDNLYNGTWRVVFLDGDFRKDPKTDHYCCRCQKDIKPEDKHRAVHLVGGGHLILHPSEEAAFRAKVKADPSSEEGRGDCGAYPIGSDCARKIGLGWTHEADVFPSSATPA